MKVFVFLIMLIILLSGCTAKVVQTKDVQYTQPAESKPAEELSKPQVTSTEGSAQETEITTGIPTEVTKAPEEPPQPESPQPYTPEVYQVNVVQGIGIKEGSG